MSGDAPSSPSYAHLTELTDHHGIFEHSFHDTARREHGYCVDDVARALIVVVREPDQTPLLAGHTETYLRFLEGALSVDGLSRNRMTASGEWVDAPGLGDWWGRSVWALGVATAQAPLRSTRERARHAFDVAASRRSPHMRAMVFATLGAAEVLRAHSRNHAARALLLAGVAMIPRASNQVWPWPEARMSYGNASIPEALIAAGQAVDDIRLIERGLALLRFLLEVETTPGHLSVTGSAGRDPSQQGPLFDQQPIEVAAIADACARAFDLTHDPAWLDGVKQCWDWFTGINDSGTEMYDEENGAGFDGLEAHGRNENRGAESTLAALATYQQARRLEQLRRATVTR